MGFHTAGYGQHRSQWVNTKNHLSRTLKSSKNMLCLRTPFTLVYLSLSTIEQWVRKAFDLKCFFLQLVTAGSGILGVVFTQLVMTGSGTNGLSRILCTYWREIKEPFVRAKFHDKFISSSEGLTYDQIISFAL